MKQNGPGALAPGPPPLCWVRVGRYASAASCFCSCISAFFSWAWALARASVSLRSSAPLSDCASPSVFSASLSVTSPTTCLPLPFSSSITPMAVAPRLSRRAGCSREAGSDLGSLRGALLGVERLGLGLVTIGLRLLANRLELLRALGLLGLAGLDQSLLVEHLTGDLLAESDNLVDQAGRVLGVDPGDSHVWWVPSTIACIRSFLLHS